MTVEVQPKRLPFFKTGKDLHERLQRKRSEPVGSTVAEG
jgi:nucleoid DNA-binding protein